MSKISNIAPRPRLQSRVSVDDQMGPYYDWFERLTPDVRGREVLAYSRLGWGMVMGQSRMGDLQPMAPLVAASETSSTTPQPDRLAGKLVTEAELTDEARAQVLGIFDMGFFAAPPPPTPLQ